MRTTLSSVTDLVAVTELPTPGLAYWMPAIDIRLEASAGCIVSVIVSVSLQPTE